MTTLTLYRSKDGLYFRDEKLCKEYEAEKEVHPDDKGIVLFNHFGQEIDIRNIMSAKYAYVDNIVLANAILHQFISLHFPNTYIAETGLHWADLYNGGMHFNRNRTIIPNETMEILKELFHGKQN